MCIIITIIISIKITIAIIIIMSIVIVIIKGRPEEKGQELRRGYLSGKKRAVVWFLWQIVIMISMAVFSMIPKRLWEIVPRHIFRLKQQCLELNIFWLLLMENIPGWRGRRKGNEVSNCVTFLGLQHTKWNFAFRVTNRPPNYPNCFEKWGMKNVMQCEKRFLE